MLTLLFQTKKTKKPNTVNHRGRLLTVRAEPIGSGLGEVLGRLSWPLGAAVIGEREWPGAAGENGARFLSVRSKRGEVKSEGQDGQERCAIHFHPSKLGRRYSGQKEIESDVMVIHCRRPCSYKELAVAGSMIIPLEWLW